MPQFSHSKKRLSIPEILKRFLFQAPKTFIFIFLLKKDSLEHIWYI